MVVSLVGQRWTWDSGGGDGERVLSGTGGTLWDTVKNEQEPDGR